MKKMIQSINKTILYFFLFIIAGITLLSFALQQFPSPLVDSMRKTTYYLILLGFVVLQFFLLWIGFCKIDKLSKKGLRNLQFILFAISLIWMSILIISFRITPITDAWAMLDQAKYLAGHPGTMVDESSPYFTYFSRYGNNAFLTILFVGFFHILNFFNIQDGYYILHGINMIMIFLGNFFAFLAVKERMGAKNGVKVLFLLTLNPISYVLVLWIYSCSLSLPLMTGILWLGGRLHHTNPWKTNILYTILIGILGGLSLLIRPTSFLPCIALALAALFSCITDKKKVTCTVLLAAMGLAACLTVTKSGSLLSRHYFEKTEKSNYPMTHWIMMGSHDSGKFDGKDEAYTFSFATKEEKTKANWEKIKENYGNLGILGTCKLWAKKLVVTFGDGWSETDIRSSADTKFSPLYSYFAGDRKDFLFFYSHSFRIVLFLFMFLAVFEKIKQKNLSVSSLSSILTLLGGMAFYCLWEAKSIYSAPFLPVMIMIAGEFEAKPLASTQKKGGKILLLTTMGISAILPLCLLCTSISLINPMVHTRYNIRGYALQFTSPIEASSLGEEILQSFYPKNDFNTLTLYADGAGNGETLPWVYEMQILDNGKNILQRKTFTSKDVHNRSITFSLNDVAVKASQPYYVKIIPQHRGSSYLQFLHRNCLTTDTYPGSLTINNTPYPYDLFMTVSYTYLGAY